jgi:hypothetical protein
MTGIVREATPLCEVAVPVVRLRDVCRGGVHDGAARGCPWLLFPGGLHCLNAGTTENESDLAPVLAGVGCVATAALDVARSATSPDARASGNATFVFKAINFLPSEVAG